MLYVCEQAKTRGVVVTHASFAPVHSECVASSFSTPRTRGCWFLTLSRVSLLVCWWHPGFSSSLVLFFWFLLLQFFGGSLNVRGRRPNSIGPDCAKNFVLFLGRVNLKHPQRQFSQRSPNFCDESAGLLDRIMAILSAGCEKCLDANWLYPVIWKRLAICWVGWIVSIWWGCGLNVLSVNSKPAQQP